MSIVPRSAQGQPSGIQGPPPPSGLPPKSTIINDGAVLNGVTSALLVLCFVAVGGRLLSRRMMHVYLEADDYLALLGLVRSNPFRQPRRFILTYCMLLSDPLRWARN